MSSLYTRILVRIGQRGYHRFEASLLAFIAPTVTSFLAILPMSYMGHAQEAWGMFFWASLAAFTVAFAPSAVGGGTLQRVLALSACETALTVLTNVSFGPEGWAIRLALTWSFPLSMFYQLTAPLRRRDERREYAAGNPVAIR